jgi:hypothetical protein
MMTTPAPSTTVRERGGQRIRRKCLVTVGSTWKTRRRGEGMESKIRVQAGREEKDLKEKGRKTRRHRKEKRRSPGIPWLQMGSSGL